MKDPGFQFSYVYSKLQKHTSDLDSTKVYLRSK